MNEVPYPPDNGVKIVSYNAMRMMSEAGHNLSICVLCEKGPSSISDYESLCSEFGIENRCIEFTDESKKLRNIVRTALCGKLYFIERFRSLSFRVALEVLVAKFEPDVIHFDLITLCQYYDVAPLGIGTVASINDCYSLKLENSLAAGNYSGVEVPYRVWQLRRSRKYESQMYPNFDFVHVMSEVDSGYLEKLNPKIETRVIPNGVSAELFNLPQVNSANVTVLFIAHLAGDNLVYLANLLDKCWPVVAREFPQSVLRIVGKIPESSRPLQTKYESVEGVRFAGYAENLVDAYEGCDIAVVPINKSGGILNKAIEAMAAGLAVVGFDKSFAGIAGARSGQHYLTAKDYEGIGEVLIALIRDQNRRDEIRAQARKFARDNFSWNQRVEAYESMYWQAARLSIEKRSGHGST